ncbi:MAG: hypothetical protein IKB35_03530, partial [Clostridia bacterium]|nr:hypothetical protein [Clostridia bacterium]
YMGENGGVKKVGEGVFYSVIKDFFGSGRYTTFYMITYDGGMSWDGGGISSEYACYEIKYTLKNGLCFLSDYTMSIHENWRTLKSIEHFKTICDGLMGDPNGIGGNAVPYFENDIGVWEVVISREITYPEFEMYYYYYITLDGGYTWTVYDPSHLVSIERVTEFDYLVNYK